VPPFLRAGPGLGHRRVRHAAALDHTRTDREAARGKQSGRTQEIQRLIGRSLRAVTDLAALGERRSDSTATCCRPTAAPAPLHHRRLRRPARRAEQADSRRQAGGNPMREAVAAVSVGIIDGVPVLDLDYAEDSACDTDMNVVMTAGGGIIEIQGTAEGAPFSRSELDR
jgi:ribonuclease PH